MKRLLLVLTAFCLVLASLSAQPYALGFGIDTSCLVDLFTLDKGMQMDIEARISINQEFSIRMPLVFTFNSTSFLFDSGLMLAYYPWLEGPFAGFSMFQYGATKSLGSYRILALNEIIVGYTYSFGDHFFAEAYMSLRDPTGAYEEEYSIIKGILPVYTTNRIRVLCGCTF